jgi:hypothetical protein
MRRIANREFVSARRLESLVALVVVCRTPTRSAGEKRFENTAGKAKNARPHARGLHLPLTTLAETFCH